MQKLEEEKKRITVITMIWILAMHHNGEYVQTDRNANEKTLEYEKNNIIVEKIVKEMIGLKTNSRAETMQRQAYYYCYLFSFI